MTENYHKIPEEYAVDGSLTHALALESIAVLKVQEFMDRKTQEEGWSLFPFKHNDSGETNSV